MSRLKEGHPDKDRSGPNPSLNSDLDPVRDSGDFQNLIWTSQFKDTFLVKIFMNIRSVNLLTC